MSGSFEEVFLWRGLIKVIRLILIISSVLAVATVFMSVILRYIFKANLFGLEELITLIAMWLYFFGGIHSSYEDSQINADVIGLLIKNPKIKHAIRIFVTGICLLISIRFAIWGIEYFLWNMHIGGASVSLRIPLIISKVPLTLCFLLMIIYNIYHFINALLGRDPIIKTENGTVCIPESKVGEV